MEPTSTASKDTSSRLKEALLQSMVQKLNREVGLRVAARRLPKSSSRELRFMIHGCFMERGDSILSVFGSELLRAKLQNKQRFSWLAN